MSEVLSFVALWMTRIAGVGILLWGVLWVAMKVEEFRLHRALERLRSGNR